MRKTPFEYHANYGNMWTKHTCELLSACYVFSAIATARTIELFMPRKKDEKK